MAGDASSVCEVLPGPPSCPPSVARVRTYTRARQGRRGATRACAPAAPPVARTPRPWRTHARHARHGGRRVRTGRSGSRHGGARARPFRIIRHMRLWPIYEQISLRQPQQRTSEQDEKKQHAVHSCPGLPHPHARIEAVSAHTTPLMGATNRYRRARATHHFPTAHRRGGSREPPSYNCRAPAPKPPLFPRAGVLAGN